MEQDELIERDLTLMVQLPGGQERPVTVHGSKPVMDLLVALCAQHHLNPSDHTIELHSTNQNQIKFKPSSLIGCLEAERIVLKPKGNDNCRKAPNMPLATVRLMVNYRVSHKAVVRVDPRAPLANLLPAICDKCEFDPSTTILLRNRWSEDPLDLTKTLNDYGIRDLYAKDTKVILSSPEDPATPNHKGCKDEKLDIREKAQMEKENRGILSLFRKGKKTTEEGMSNSNSAPTSPVLNTQNMVNISLKSNSPGATLPADVPKKRRAPQPPSMPASQSFPCGLNSSQSAHLPTGTSGGNQAHVSSTESSLKRTKRRAPPPPCISPSYPDPSDKGASLNLPSVEETQEEAEVPSYFSEGYQYSDSITECWPQSSPSLMSEILFEFKDKMKTHEERELSSDSSVTYLSPAASPSPNRQSVPGSPESIEDAGLMTPLFSGLLRQSPQRKGVNTFTVVPQRRQSTRKYEVCITLEASSTLESIAKLEPRHKHEIEPDVDCGNEECLNPKESEDLEMSENQMVTPENEDGEDEKPEEGSGKLLEVVEQAFDSLQLNVDTENLLAEEISEDEDKDWIAVYRERRRKFQTDGDKKAIQLDQSTKKLSYKILEDARKDMEEGFPQPPPTSPATPVYWEEEESKRENCEEEETKKEEGIGTEENDKELNYYSAYPKLFSCDTQRDSMADISNVSDLHWEKLPWSTLNSIYSNANFVEPHLPETYLSQDHLHSKLEPKPDLSNHQNGTEPSSPSVSCHPEKGSPSAPLSQGTVSPFALAVSRRVESLIKDGYTLTPSTQETRFRTKPFKGCVSQSCPAFKPSPPKYLALKSQNCIKLRPTKGSALKSHHLEGSWTKPCPIRGSVTKPHLKEGSAIEPQLPNGSFLKPRPFKCPTHSFYPLNL